MEVVVTFNVSTDLDVTDGAREHLVDSVLNAREEINEPDPETRIARPTYLYPGTDDAHQSTSP